MPKKGKKGKKGKGKKGKSAKKGKKDATVKSMSEANSKLWETRVELAEKARDDFRDNARQLVVQNDSLHNQMHQTEKDTIDVVTYLKRQDLEKDKQIEKVIQQMKDLKKDHRKEQERIVEDFQTQLTDVESKLGQKTQEAEVLQAELKMVKEFRRKRSQMQRELEEIKETMFAANREHKDTLARMEQKFFEEKMRLQQEANLKIAELAERAHTEAIANLDETTRSVYKENVRVSEALSYHMLEGDKLKAGCERLEKENQELQGEQELNNMVIHDKVAQGKHQKHTLKQLQERVETLEQSLSHVVHEFETERRALVEKASLENESSIVEISKLQRTVDLKTREMSKVKKLARNILDQRTEMERFFLEALEQVKLEIATNRVHYRKDAQAAYTQKMLAAHKGKAEFPMIRTFNKGDNSTNSVFRDLEAAERLFEISGKVDISDLTWEQREKVLRFLFAKMNGTSAAMGGQRHKTAHPALQAPPSHSLGGSVPSLAQKSAWGDEDPVDETFLTNAQVDHDHSMTKLPSLHQMSLPVQAETVT